MLVTVDVVDVDVYSDEVSVDVDEGKSVMVCDEV